MSALISSTMVDRTAQLGALQTALAATADSGATIVLIGGEAGVGKTRLLAELATSLSPSPTRIVRGQCVELGGDGLAYAPIAGTLRDLAGQIGPERLLELAGPSGMILSGLLPTLGGSGIDIDEGRVRLFEVFTMVLERAAAEQPLILMIEDLHWADGSTRDLLRFVIRALGRARVLLLCTYRTDEMHRTHPLKPFLAELDRLPHVRRLEVPRLSKDGVVQQLSNIRAGVSPTLAEQIYQRSGGIPFFVEELAATGDNDAFLPETLRDLLMVRVEQLSHPAQQLLRLMAVGGNSIEHALLEAVYDSAPEALDEAARELVSANVVRVEGSAYTFRHALVRESVHDDLLPGEHGRLHQRYAETLEECPTHLQDGAAAAEVAHHWNAAKDQDRAFPAMITAADHALTKFAYSEALQMFERALELWGQVSDPEAVSGGDHADLLARASSAANDAGDLDRSLSLIEAARAEVSDDPIRMARMAYYRGRLLSELGRPETIPVLEEGLSLVPADPPSTVRARLLQMLGSRLMMMGEFERAIEVGREAAATARAAGDEVAEFRSHDLLGPAMIYSGRITEGFAAFAVARELARSSARSMVSYRINLSDTLHVLGRSAEAVELGREGIDRAIAAGLARSLGTMLIGNTAEPLIAVGEWDEADRLIKRGMELDPPFRHAMQLLILQSSLRLWQGDLETSARSLSEAQSSLARRQHGPQYTVPSARIEAELALAAGDADRAWDLTSPTLTHPLLQRGQHPALLWVCARAVGARARAGRLTAAEVERDRAAVLTAIDAFGDWGITAVWRAYILAELAPGTDGSTEVGLQSELWRTALAVWADRTGPAQLLPNASFRLAWSLIEVGERTAAAAVMTEATEQADRLGAGLVSGWIDDLARRSGIGTAEAAPDMASPVGGLTPRELEVLSLVTDGLSNRQIGTELFITTKTASVHVSNILAKLGVATRGEAAAVANQTNGSQSGQTHPVPRKAVHG